MSVVAGTGEKRGSGRERQWDQGSQGPRVCGTSSWSERERASEWQCRSGWRVGDVAFEPRACVSL